MTARARTIWTFVVTSVALFMAQLDNLVVTTALPVIRGDLHASLSSHVVPSVAAGLSQVPVVGSHVPTRWHWSSGTAP